MNRYCLVRVLKEEHVEDYIELHKNPWPEILTAIEKCGCHNLLIYRYENLAILFFECEDINMFYQRYGSLEIVKKWNATVEPWVAESPTLDGTSTVHTLEKIFDFRQQLHGKLVQPGV